MTSNEFTSQQQLAQAEQEGSRTAARAGSGRIISSLRAIGMALMLFAGAFSVGYADHMGNHERGPAESTESGSSQACGQDIVDLPSTSDDESDSSFSHGSRPW